MALLALSAETIALEKRAFAKKCVSTVSTKVGVQFFDDNKPVALPVTSFYKSFTSHWSWNAWNMLPNLFTGLPCGRC
ncbi:hypothetical protein quinque_002310 [Culex quinquefasciatus]